MLSYWIEEKRLLLVSMESNVISSSMLIWTLQGEPGTVQMGILLTPPSSIPYDSFVIRNSIITYFLISALNDFYILAGNIQNAYLNAHTKDMGFFYAGDECKSDKRKVVLIFRSLYGLKSSSLTQRNHFSYILGNYLRFKSSLTDPHFW